MQPCNAAFTDFVVQCPTVLQVYAQLSPLSAYDWIITDKFGHQYSGAIMTDADGFFQIPVEDLPAGLLTAYSGQFKLEVIDAGCKPVKFKMAGEYTAVHFSVKAGSRVKATIGCDFTCSGTAGGTNMIVWFTDATTVTLDWDTYRTMFGNNPSVQVYHETETPDVYELTTVEISQVRTDDVLVEVTINNGGPASGYILLS